MLENRTWAIQHTKPLIKRDSTDILIFYTLIQLPPNSLRYLSNDFKIFLFYSSASCETQIFLSPGFFFIFIFIFWLFFVSKFKAVVWLLSANENTVFGKGLFVVIYYSVFSMSFFFSNDSSSDLYRVRYKSPPK